MNDQWGRVQAQVAVSQHAPPHSDPGGAALGRQRGPRSSPLLALAVAVAAVLVACSPSPVITPVPTVAPTPTVTPTATVAPPSAAPTPAATPVAGAPDCEPADLKASHGLVEGAAGSRLTTVVLTSAINCSIDAFPAMGLRDASGASLVGAASSGPGRLDLAAGGVYETNVRLANWCAPDPDFPLALEVVLGADELPVTGTSFPEQGDLPPCSGAGGPILEATQWVAAPA